MSSFISFFCSSTLPEKYESTTRSRDKFDLQLPAREIKLQPKAISKRKGLSKLGVRLNQGPSCILTELSSIHYYFHQAVQLLPLDERLTSTSASPWGLGFGVNQLTSGHALMISMCSSIILFETITSLRRAQWTGLAWCHLWGKRDSSSAGLHDEPFSIRGGQCLHRF